MKKYILRKYIVAIVAISFLILYCPIVIAAGLIQDLEQGTGWIDNDDDNQSSWTVGDYHFHFYTTPGKMTRSQDTAYSGYHSLKIIHSGSVASAPQVWFEGDTGFDTSYQYAKIKVTNGQLAGTSIGSALKLFVHRNTGGADNDLYTVYDTSFNANKFFFQDADDSTYTNKWLYFTQNTSDPARARLDDMSWHTIKMKMTHVTGTQYYMNVWIDGKEVKNWNSKRDGTGTWHTMPATVYQSGNADYIRWCINFSGGGQPACTWYLDDLYFGDTDPDSTIVDRNAPAVPSGLNLQISQ